MSRPQRIVYENAYYHVMNHGASGRQLFHNDDDHQVFLNTVEEAHYQFNIEVHAYLLMKNHYHLLIKTPRGNLSRAMRHINGVYTQRYNRSRKMDGALFRGRYKAILVDADSYLLHLSKYIHLLPLTERIVTDLIHYPWSSYPAYVGHLDSPRWLMRDEIYRQLTTQSQESLHYHLFMNSKIFNESLMHFYSKERLSPILGDESFINQLTFNKPSIETSRGGRIIQQRLTLLEIINQVAIAFNQESHQLTAVKKGRGRKNCARKIAMYIAQKHGDYKLNEIAQAFDLKHYGSVSSAISCVAENLKTDLVLSGNIKCIVDAIHHAR